MPNLGQLLFLDHGESLTADRVFRSLVFALAFLGLARLGGAVPLEISFSPGGGGASAGEREVEVAARSLAVGGQIVQGKGRLRQAVRLELPAGSLWRVEAKAAGFWIQPEDVAVGSVPVTKTFRFYRAGELTGELAPPPGTRPPGELVARLRAAPGFKGSLGEISSSCSLDRRRFRCAVPAGTFDLRLRAKGFITHYRWGLKIPPDEPTGLGLLKLEPGASVVGWLEVPAPSFRLAPDSTDTVKQGAASPEGVFVARGLEPGSYHYRVLGSYRSRWVDEAVAVPPGGATATVELPFLEVEGEVRYGGEPISALLWFGGEFGTTRIPAKSSPEGQYSVVLPERSGTWRVEIKNPLENIYSLRSAVAIERSAGKRTVRVDFDLDKNVLAGEVVDEDGRKVPNARVRAASHSSAVNLRASAPEGRFEIKAAEPGRWELQASRDGDASAPESESVVVDLAKGEERQVQLVLRPVKKFTGLVVGPSGQPIPGARVVGLLEQTGRFLTGITPESYTDAAGLFDLRLPGRAQWLQLTLLPPGHAITQFRVNVERTPSLTLPVGALGGTLVFDGGQPPGAPWWRVELFGERRVAFIDALRQWASLYGYRWEGEDGRFAIPMLEPGRYTACLDVLPEVLLSGLPPAGEDPRCVTGEVPPGGTLALHLPRQKAPEKAGEARTIPNRR